MSSCAISSRTNNNKEKQEYNEPEELLSQGIEKIYHSFNVNNKRYKDKISENERIISGLTKKMENLSNEMEMIQRENTYYKTQNEKLKKEVDKLNKIVKKIQGKLSSVDFQINECIKDDNNNKNNIKKNENYNKRKKHNSLYITYQNENEDKNQSLSQVNTKNFLFEENHKNANYDNKNSKNKKLAYYIDNKVSKDNGNKINYEKEIKKELNNNNMGIDTKKKINKTVGYNSFDLNSNINDNNKQGEILKTPNSILYKNIIAKEAKKKNNNRVFDNDQPRETSLSCQDNNKYRSYSSKQFMKEKEKNIINNKSTEEVKMNNIINKDDLYNDKISPNNKGYDSNICLTYDNLFNKINSKKKNSYISFRGRILNKNISENIFKSGKFKREKSLNNEIIERATKNNEITYFLKKCKINLEREVFDKVIKLFQDYKNGLITDEGIIIKTQNYLGNNNELIELFNKVFSNNYINS